MISTVVLEVVGVTTLAVLALWADDERTAWKMRKEKDR